MAPLPAEAAALASYAKQSNDKTLENAAMRIRARAVRRCGELLAEVEKAHGKRTDLELGGSAPTKFSRSDAAQEAGLSKDQAVTALRVANVPAESFEQQGKKPAPLSRIRTAFSSRPGLTGPPAVPMVAA